MKPTFNLINKPWIPCINNQGQRDVLSWQEMFERAHDLKGIETDSPLNTAALYRLSLAIIHRAVRGPKTMADWYNLWKLGRFSDAPIIDYLKQWKPWFDIFSDRYPFYQTPEFKTDNPPLPISKLTIELASKNNKTLFDHSMDENPPFFTPQEAANSLITAQMYSLGGGKGPKSSLFDKHPNYASCFLANGVLALLKGNSLFETLMLNLIIYTESEPVPCSDYDLPVWEREDSRERKPGVYAPDGYIHLLTWRNRHILLIPEFDNGQIVVRRMYYGQAESLTKKNVREPMFVYPKSGKPLALSANRALWRDSSSLFAFNNAEDTSRPYAFRNAAQALEADWIPAEQSMSCMVFGIASDQGNPLIWRREDLPISPKILTDEELPFIIKTALDFADKMGKVLKDAIGKFATIVLTEKKRKVDSKERGKYIKSLGTEDYYWDSIELPFRGLLSQLFKSNDLSEWKLKTTKNARIAFINTTENSLTRSARELQARVEALAYL
ncbi:MAG: type I-E CRISPR-associated protein Cse1/CasA, partial [Desulfobacteraceae bacterium]